MEQRLSQASRYPCWVQKQVPRGWVCVTGVGKTRTSPREASAKGVQSSMCQEKERRQEKGRRNDLSEVMTPHGVFRLSRV